MEKGRCYDEAKCTTNREKLYEPQVLCSRQQFSSYVPAKALFYESSGLKVHEPLGLKPRGPHTVFFN